MMIRWPKNIGPITGLINQAPTYNKENMGRHPLPNVKLLLSLALPFILLTVSSLEAHQLPSKNIDPMRALTLANKAIGKKVSNHKLIDQDGNPFNLEDLSGKPLVVSFIYTNCPHICPTITAHLADAVKKSGGDFGKEFRVLTIGFDSERDTPQRMREYGSGFTEDFKGWRFATGDKETIKKLSEEFGFSFQKRDNDFIHLNMTTILDAEGRVYKHVFGVDFKPEEVLVPLERLLKREKRLGLAQIVDKLKLFCSTYDPSAQTYKFDFGRALAVAVQLVLLVTVSLLVWGKGLYSFLLKMPFRKRRP